MDGLFSLGRFLFGGKSLGKGTYTVSERAREDVNILSGSAKV